MIRLNTESDIIGRPPEAKTFKFTHKIYSLFLIHSDHIYL
jgi:hypothetical protein